MFFVVVVFSDYLPGQGFDGPVQAWDSVPEPTQSRPKLAGAGLSQALTRVWVPEPLPQVLEHVPQLSHEPQLPSTIVQKRV